MKRAILNASDTGAAESTAHMLECAGYSVARPDDALLHQVRWEARCQGAFSVAEMVRDWGYSPVRVDRLASPDDVKTCDLFVDVKAHVNYAGIVGRWPHLAGKVLWLCLNGGNPCKRTDGLPWADPPCPVVTHNQWYARETILKSESPWGGSKYEECLAPWIDRAYTCYPPYRRLAERRRAGMTGPPVCLVHRVAHWGYGHLVEPFKALGVKFYGGGDGNERLLPHDEAMTQLHSSLCLVHVKNGDTVGYAVVEAMASGCPVVCTQHYIDETRLHELLVPGETCLTFDDGRDGGDAIGSLAAVLARLRDPTANRLIGEQGRARMTALQWEAGRDAAGWREWMRRNFK